MLHKQYINILYILNQDGLPREAWYHYDGSYRQLIKIYLITCSALRITITPYYNYTLRLRETTPGIALVNNTYEIYRHNRISKRV